MYYELQYVVNRTMWKCEHNDRCCTVDLQVQSEDLQKRCGPEVIKPFFMLNPGGHDILNAHKYTHIKIFSIFKAQKILECYFSCS